MNSQFTIVGGSILGHTHFTRKRNCQDAYRIYQRDDFSLALVADGCSNHSKSEVGANLLLLWVEQLCIANLRDYKALSDPYLFLRFLSKQLQSQMNVLAGGDMQTLLDFFSTTILGILVFKEKTYIFGCGDGCFSINGKTTIKEPLEGNVPSYLVYSLIDERSLSVKAKSWDLELFATLDTDTVDSLLLGTDGAVTLLEHTSVDELTSNEALFTNPFALGKLLFKLNRVVHSIDWIQQKSESTKGILDDDTTVILVKRRTD